MNSNFNNMTSYRRQIYNYLVSTFTSPILPPNIYICCPNGSGKDYILASAFSECNIPFVVLNASTIALQFNGSCTHRQFYSSMQRNIYRKLNSFFRQSNDRSKPSSMHDILNNVEYLWDDEYKDDTIHEINKSPKWALIVNNADRLSSTLLLVLMKAADDFHRQALKSEFLRASGGISFAKKCQFTLVTTGRIPMDYISLRSNMISKVARRTITLSLPGFTKNELVNILVGDFKQLAYTCNQSQTTKSNEDQVEGLIRAIVSAHYPVTRRLLDIRLAAHPYLEEIARNFIDNVNKENEEYGEHPSDNKRFKGNEVTDFPKDKKIYSKSLRRMYANISVQLTAGLRRLTERRINLDCDVLSMEAYPLSHKKQDKYVLKVKSKEHDPHRLELPYYLKVILLSAFIAARNNPKSDRRLFGVKIDRTRKRNLTQSRKISLDTILVKANRFTFNRLMSICTSIDMNRYTGFDRSSAQAGLALLESLNLVSRSRTHFSKMTKSLSCGRRCLISYREPTTFQSLIVEGDSKFECHVNLELTLQIASSLQLDLETLLDK